MGLVVVCQKAVVFRGWTGAIAFPCNPCKQCCVWGAKQVGCQIVCMIYEHVSGMGTFSLSRCWCFALLFHPQLRFCLACDVLTCGTHVVDERPGGTRTGLLTCGNGALDHDGHPDWSYLLFRVLLTLQCTQLHLNSVFQCIMEKQEALQNFWWNIAVIRLYPLHFISDFFSFLLFMVYLLAFPKTRHKLNW